MRLGAALGEQGVNFFAGNHHPGILQDGIPRGVEFTIADHPINRRTTDAESAGGFADAHGFGLSLAHTSIIANNASNLYSLDEWRYGLYNTSRPYGMDA